MSQNSKVFLVRAGQSGEDEDRVLEDSIAILGYLDVPSLASATDYKGVQEIVARTFPDSKAAVQWATSPVNSARSRWQ